MKLKKIWIALIAIISLGVFASNTSDVSAKSNTAIYPKNMRGTWYHYDKYTKKMEKSVYTKNKSFFYTDGKKLVGYLHNKPKSTPRYSKKTAGWEYIMDHTKVRGKNWITLYGWDQSSGAGAHLNVSKLNGHWVLTNATGPTFYSSEHWYRSAKLAKKLRNHHYPGFAY